MQYYLLGIAIGIVLLNVLYINITVWRCRSERKGVKTGTCRYHDSHNYAKVGDSTQRTGAERKERCIRF